MGAPSIFVTARAPVAEQDLGALQVGEVERQGVIAVIGYLGHRLQPAGAPGMTRDQHQLAIARPGG